MGTSLKTPTEELQDWKQLNRDRLDETLDQILETKIAAAAQVDESYAQLWQEVSSLIRRGGKRLRPLLFLLSYQGFGGKDEATVYRIAASQEIFHAFILVHDDIIDRDNTRWGGPNISGRYKQILRPRITGPDITHYASGYALMAGDMCLGLSNELIVGSQLQPDKIVEISKLMQECLFSVIGGEVLDVGDSIGLVNLSDEQLLKMYSYKTASYSFQAPLKLGGIIAGADPTSLAVLSSCAECLGVAYQLQDDLLGIFSDIGSIGKSNLSDLREGKKTLLMRDGLKHAKPSQRRKLQTKLGNPLISPSDLIEVRQILEDTGSRERLNMLVESYLLRSRKLLWSLQASLENIELVDALIDQLVKRNN